MLHAGHFLRLSTLLLVLCAPIAAAAAAATVPAAAKNVPYSFQPLSPRAIPAVAIIGTAKAGTTDLYTLLTRTSRMAPGGHSKRTKEAKLLIEEGRKVQPGSKDFHEYLLRIGHPCADSADPRRHQPAAAGQPEAFKECMQDLAAQHNPTAPSNSSSSSSSSQLPLSIDATPIYLALPQAAAALKSISKDTKVILLLRHPVDRAQSLYNHRVATEANKHLPQRVMNHTISEWATRFLDWVDATPNARQLLSDLGQAASLEQQVAAYQQLLGLNLLGLPENLPLTFPNYNRAGIIERNIFGSALYAGALAAWRRDYFAPGRVMVIDSHAFFAARLEVTDAVYRFVHGVGLSDAGRHIAARTAVQNARRSAGIEFAGAKLDPGVRARIRDFYQPHIDLLLNNVLPAMEREGGLVLGFEGPPWVAVQQH